MISFRASDCSEKKKYMSGMELDKRPVLGLSQKSHFFTLDPVSDGESLSLISYSLEHDTLVLTRWNTGLLRTDELARHGTLT